MSVDPAELAELLPVARRAVAIARDIIRERGPSSVVTKGDRDLVTDVDLAVEDAVREFLTKETPEIGILGEEHGHTGPDSPEDSVRNRAPNEALWWAVDPVDGTSNFARSIPLCGVSLGLVHDRNSVLAAIDLPFLAVTYTAAAGLGAWVADQRIHTSSVRELRDAVIAIGDFAVGDGAEAKNRLRLELLRQLGQRAQRVRMLGSAAIDLAWVADGKLDAAIILANLPWDTMAGTILVREAGGVVLDEDGSTHTADSSATIATSASLRDQLEQCVQRARTAVAAG